MPTGYAISSMDTAWAHDAVPTLLGCFLEKHDDSEDDSVMNMHVLVRVIFLVITASISAQAFACLMIMCRGQNFVQGFLTGRDIHGVPIGLGSVDHPPDIHLPANTKGVIFYRGWESNKNYAILRWLPKPLSATQFTIEAIPDGKELAVHLRRLEMPYADWPTTSMRYYHKPKPTPIRSLCPFLKEQE